MCFDARFQKKMTESDENACSNLSQFSVLSWAGFFYTTWYSNSVRSFASLKGSSNWLSTGISTITFNLLVDVILAQKAFDK